MNKYDIYSQGWYLPVSKRIIKALKKRKKYRESITKDLDMIKEHMQCIQEASGEMCATQGSAGTLCATQKPSDTLCAIQEPSDDSCCNQAEQVKNPTGFSTTNPWDILDHPCVRIVTIT